MPNDDQAARKGPLNPEPQAGQIVVKDPPNEPLLLTPDEADISGLRLLDAADKARKKNAEPG